MMREGWLAIQHGSEKRRVVPVPVRRHEWGQDQLARVVREAKPAPLQPRVPPR